MSASEAVLHVEDDEFVTRSLRRWLERRGFSVVSSGSCAEARGVETSFVYGIFDIDLPDGDGMSLATELLSRGTVKKALFYTATSDADALDQAKKIGPVVTKGDDLKNLLAALANAAPRTEHSMVPSSGVEGPPSPKANVS